MFALDAKVLIDAKIQSGLTQREFDKTKKQSLHDSVVFWHKNIAPKHFRRKAYYDYPGVYDKRKRSGDPMVRYGFLKESVLSRINVSGTSKKASGKMFYGRPSGATGNELRNLAFSRMERTGSNFKVAFAHVLKNQGGYGAVNRAVFQKQATAFNVQDMSLIKALILREIKKHFKPSGKKVRVKRGAR